MAFMNRSEMSKRIAAKTRRKYGEDYFAKIGRKGGKKGWRGKGFASELLDKNGMSGYERAAKAGSKGGKKSRRGSSKNKWYYGV